MATGMVCRGVKSDAEFLVRGMRRLGGRIWERYGAVLDARGVANALGDVLLGYAGYDPDETFRGVCLVPEGEDAGRPFGVQTVVMPRDVFCASTSNTCLFSCDYSQNEVRILAHM